MRTQTLLYFGLSEFLAYAKAEGGARVGAGAKRSGLWNSSSSSGSELAEFDRFISRVISRLIPLGKNWVDDAGVPQLLVQGAFISACKVIAPDRPPPARCLWAGQDSTSFAPFPRTRQQAIWQLSVKPNASEAGTDTQPARIVSSTKRVGIFRLLITVRFRVGAHCFPAPGEWSLS